MGLAGRSTRPPPAGAAEACAPLHPVTFNHPWLLNQPEVHTVWFGPANPGQPDRYSRVGENDGWVPGVKGTRCTQCGDCLPRCPEHLQIPEPPWAPTSGRGPAR